eukprot:1077940-Pyramimonas_sp.AAC.1
MVAHAHTLDPVMPSKVTPRFRSRRDPDRWRSEPRRMRSVRLIGQRGLLAGDHEYQLYAPPPYTPF